MTVLAKSTKSNNTNKQTNNTNKQKTQTNTNKQQTQTNTNKQQQQQPAHRERSNGRIIQTHSIKLDSTTHSPQQITYSP